MIKEKELFELLKKKFIPILESKQALGIYTERRQQFEGWVQVELIDLLKEYRPIPEKDNIDITIDNEWAIEIKVVSTNYQAFYNDVYGYRLHIPRGARNITDQKLSIINDIEKLHQFSNNYNNCAILLIVFPLLDNNLKWMRHDSEKSNLQIYDLIKFDHVNFSFFNNIDGILYFGKLTNGAVHLIT